MRSEFVLLAAAGLAFTAPATAQTIGMKVNNPAADAAQKILNAPLKIATFTYRGGVPTALPPVATHICLLSGFTGKLAGAGEQGKLYIDNGAPGGARYMLGGNTQQAQFKVMAHCASRDQFAWNSAGAPQPKVSALVEGSGCAAQNRLMKDVQGAPFLAAFGGRFAGGGEMVAIQPSLFGAMGNIAACSGTLTAGAIAYAAPKPLVYRSLTARTTRADESTYFFGIGDNRKDTLAFALFSNSKFFQKGVPQVVPYNEAFCGLTALTGKFNGFGETAEVKPSGDYWFIMLNFSSSANEPYVGAGVRCLSRDQRSVG